MVKHLFYVALNTSPCRTSARQGGERSGPCRDVRVTELCEVKGDVTIPELKEQQYEAHSPSYESADKKMDFRVKRKEKSTWIPFGLVGGLRYTKLTKR